MSSMHRTIDGEVLVRHLSQDELMIDRELLAQRGRTARTIVKEGPVRLVLMALSPGGDLPIHSTDGPVTIHVTDGDQPYMKNWWVPGLQIGYEHSFVHQVADFLQNVAGNKSTSPTFREALETTRVCDAVLASAKAGSWKDVSPNAR